MSSFYAKTIEENSIEFINWIGGCCVVWDARIKIFASFNIRCFFRNRMRNVFVTYTISRVSTTFWSRDSIMWWKSGYLPMKSAHPRTYRSLLRYSLETTRPPTLPPKPPAPKPPCINIGFPQVWATSAAYQDTAIPKYC